MNSNIHDDNGFYFGITDCNFKNILFGSDEELTKWYLEKTLDIKVSTIRYINTNFPKDYKDGKDRTMDVLLLVNNEILIDIEANSSYYKTLYDRNFTYATMLYKMFVVDLKIAKKVVLMDFTRGLCGYYEIKNEFGVQTKHCIRYVQNFENYVFDIDKALKFWYIGNKQGIKENFHLIILALGKDDLLELSNLEYISEIDRKYIQTYRRRLIDMNLNDAILKMWKERQEIYEADIRNQISDSHDEGVKEGINQGIVKGIEQNQIDIAIKMLRDNVNPEIIEKYIGLPINKIKELEGGLFTT